MDRDPSIGPTPYAIRRSVLKGAAALVGRPVDAQTDEPRTADGLKTFIDRLMAGRS